MLLELIIENLALFERASLAFGSGLNVITGETGAGKSLLIGALELLLGERPRASMVRKGASEARVEGRFVLSADNAAAPEIARWFDENLPAARDEWAQLGADDERELILGRSLSSEGKSRAWINHRPVTQRVLRELAALLVEIHGQSEHQKLLENAEQTRLLDAFGEQLSLLALYRERRAAWLAISAELAQFEARARERRDRLDLLRFQARELGDARLSADEHRDLERERGVLRHAGELGTQLGALVADLSESEGAALDVVRRAQRVLEHWESKVAGLGEAAQELREALLHLEEAVAGVAGFLERVEYSPERLEAVEQRLYQLELLEKKYATDVAGLLAQQREIASELAALESQAEDRAALAQQCALAHAELERAADELTQARRALRSRLKRAVQSSLKELGLERASFEVSVEPRAAPDLRSPNAARAKTEELAEQRRFGIDGQDTVEFFLAANPGEEAQPLRAVASGGETARIMLALRTALAVRQTIPTLVFDEIDAGVGGRLGPKVGEHLRALAAHHQVLCVTHLPAIAALAHRHFKVEKSVERGRTKTGVGELTGEARVEEVADMIAGGAAHATARAEARRLLGE